MKRRVLLSLMLLGLIAIVLVACGGGESATDETTSSAAETSEEASMPVEATGSESGDELPPPPESGVKVVATRTASDEAVADTAVEPRVVSEPAESEMVAGGEMAVADVPLQTNSQLTAGEVDDNANWDDYVQYLRTYQGAAIIEIDVTERHQIWVQNSAQRPVMGALIEIFADDQLVTTLRTHSNGRALFFPRAFPVQSKNYTVNVTVDGQTETFALTADDAQREWMVNFPNADQSSGDVQLDVLFLIDATGSMSDEINQLKDNIRAISAQIDSLPSQPDVRFGMVTYRDREDAYLVNVTDFTPDVDTFAQALGQVQADGGGDYPEDLNEALSQAIHAAEWRIENTVSLIFLVADAPPHLDYGQQNHYGVEVFAANTRGIKIYPIASSGLDSQGEYIFRQLGQITGGRFVFLTYGDSGPGSSGTETSFDVSGYTVSALDDLVVRIIEEELAYLRP